MRHEILTLALLAGSLLLRAGGVLPNDQTVNNAPVGTSDLWDFTAEWSERGYINVYDEQRALFYWAWHGLDAKPTSPGGSEPFVLWLSGRDTLGASSISDLFFLNGPYKIINFPGPYGEDTLKMAQNPFKWSMKAHFVWLDEPAGAGYSYSNTSDPVNTIEKAASDVCEFLSKFYAKYEEFESFQLFIAGDGASARIILQLSDMLLERNGGDPNICPETKFGGIAMAGPDVNVKDKWSGMVETIQEQDLFNKEMVHAVSVMADDCINGLEDCAGKRPGQDDSTHYDWAACYTAYAECDLQMNFPRKDFDVYDYRSSGCVVMDRSTECYIEHTIGINRWMVEPVVFAGYQIPEFAEYAVHNTTVSDNLQERGAFLEDFSPYIERALDAGIRVLMWTGEFDYVGNVIGLNTTVSKLEWGGGAFKGVEGRAPVSWSAQEKDNYPVSPEFSDGVPEDLPEVHYWRNDRLTFAIVYGAGHHLAFNKPRGSQLFFTDWLYGFGDSLQQAEQTKERYATAAVIVGSIVGLCLLGGVFCYFGLCPNPKWYNHEELEGPPTDEEFNPTMMKSENYRTTQLSSDKPDSSLR